MVFGFRQKYLWVFRIWYPMWFSVFSIWIPVPLRFERQFFASTGRSLIAAKPILLHLSPLYRIYKGFDNQNVKICRFCVRFSVLIDIFSVFSVLSFFFFCFLLFCDFGIFSSTVLRFWNIFFYGFAISNRPQCPPYRGN